MTPEKQLEILRRGAVEILSEGELLAKLKKNKPLRVKLGVDPTAPDIHLGFTVVMRKLRAFQELGHQVVLIVGDYTATVGDPSGKNKTRPMLSHEEVLENAKTYQEQFFKIVDREKTEVVYNGSWFGPMTFHKVTELMAQITVAQMLEREDFQNRYRGGQPISLHEFLYPMMQGYDSVEIKADVELGGTDQKFNIIRGRDLQKYHGQDPQVGLFMPILLGTDGKAKMSKSLGNTIGIDEDFQSMYHKLYNLPDELVSDYCTLLTDIPLEEIDSMKKRVNLSGSAASAATDSGTLTSAKTLSPNQVKELLAKTIVEQYHGNDKAEEAAQKEKKIHAGEILPEDTPVITVATGEYWVPALMVQAKLSQSNGEARRLIQNGGVTFDGKKITDPKANVTVSEGTNGEHVLKVGKRKFVKIRPE